MIDLSFDPVINHFKQVIEIKRSLFLPAALEADAFTTGYGFAPNLTGMSLALGNSGDLFKK